MEFITAIGGKLVPIAIDAIIEAVQGRTPTDEERAAFVERIAAKHVLPYEERFPANPNRISDSDLPSE